MRSQGCVLSGAPGHNPFPASGAASAPWLRALSPSSTLTLPSPLLSLLPSAAHRAGRHEATGPTPVGEWPALGDDGCGGEEEEGIPPVCVRAIP